MFFPFEADLIDNLYAPFREGDNLNNQVLSTVSTTKKHMQSFSACTGIQYNPDTNNVASALLDHWIIEAHCQVAKCICRAFVPLKDCFAPV